MITLVIGGARSGKSAVAEERAAALANGGPVVYVATASPGDDADLAARIRSHQIRRPAAWRTVEAGTDLPAALRGVHPDVTVIIDSLGTWLGSQPDLAVDVVGVLVALRVRSGATVVVSEEVGLGVHPSTEAGRRFRDALGELNQAVAEEADEVLLVVAGRILPLVRP